MELKQVQENTNQASISAPGPESPTSLLSDTPARRDVLGYKDYRDALVSVIERFDPATTLTVGVFGDWGSGKTTLLNLVKDKLESRNAQNIWVNIWKYGNEEDVWAAFLQALLLMVKERMPWYKRLLFNMGLLGRRINWEEVPRKALALLGRIAIVVVPLYLSLSNLLPSDQSEQSTTGTVAAGAGTLLSGVLGWYLLLQPYVQEIRKRVRVDLTQLIRTSPLRDRVSILDHFRTFFEAMVVSLVGKKGRLVVFVDDLDRCPPERIVQVLDALKLFLDTPRCVYVIGLDRDIIEQAVKSKFEGYENDEAEAREYLEKIIGLPFDLPPLSRDQMEALVGGLDINLPDAELSTQVFALGQEPNPRKVKRTINVFLLLWTLAQRREQLRDVIKPSRLAKIVVIQHSYRELYSILTVTPRALGELELYFRQPEGQSEEMNTEKSGEDADASPALSEYLKPFVGNENLKRLLTLHSGQDEESQDVNFVLWRDGKYDPIAEDEIRSYIGLTHSVTREQSSNLRDADLRGADLSGQDLARYDLTGANLAKANLQDANLLEASLGGASLIEANVTNANLSQADLTNAILDSARLIGADLSDAALRGARFRGTYLEGAMLAGADLEGADLRQALYLTQEQVDQALVGSATRLPESLKPT